jgi:eukaryotic-like serine/threonine-protein kinase
MNLREQLQQTLGDAYTLERELGGGGMSRVFVAHDTTLERKVVIKVLPPELAAAVSLDRFKREIQVAAKLQHPNIVPVLSSGATEGLPYYTMPLVQGESLRARIARDGALPIHDVIRILRDVLSALAYAHENGIVHRDIKPDNVLLAKNASQVTDFGIAKALSAAAAPGSFVTSLGVALGSPAYMAPEQVAADPSIDHRADIYAVGAMAYEMVSGSQLFPGRTPQATMAAHAIERPEPLEAKQISVPDGLAALIMRAIEKDAADRPQSADEMLDELNTLSTPVAGSKPTVVSTAGDPVATKSRRTAIVGVGLAMVIAIIAGVSFLLGRGDVPVAATQPRLAVLPFENGGVPADAYFADGMTEAITNRLASISGLSVIGRQSAKRYVGSDKSPQQIGSELGVNYLLTGSIRWDRSQPGRNFVSIRPALLRVADGTQVWGEPYEAVLAGEFKLQSEVAEKVARSLNVALLPHESRALATMPTTDPVAYDEYLRGRFFWNKRTATALEQSLDHFNKAIARDPRFARAYAGLADLYVVMPSYTDIDFKASMTAARTTAERAIALDSTLGAPHAALGTMLRDERRWKEAEREFKRAITLEPTYATTYQWYSRMLVTQGRFKEAIPIARRARELDPMSVVINLNLGTMQYYAGDYPAAEATFKGAIALDAANPSTRWGLSQVLVVKKDYPAAIAQLDTALALSDSTWTSAMFAGYRSYALARSGDTASARVALRSVKRNAQLIPNYPHRTLKEAFVLYEIALLHLALYEPDSAVAWLERYYNDPVTSDALLLRSPHFQPLRSNPRFQSMMQGAIRQ